MQKTLLLCLTCAIALYAGVDDAHAQGHSAQRYGLPQAFIEYKISGGMFAGSEQLYFDQYGRREAKYTQQQIKVMGMNQETHTATFTDFNEGVIYTYDFNTKSGTRMDNPLQDAFRQQDIREVGEKMMLQMGGRKIGTGEVLGRPCDIWEIKSMGTKTWVWKWISLKTETNMMGNTMTIEAIKISETYDKKKLEKPNVPYRDMGNVLKGFKGLPEQKRRQ